VDDAERVERRGLARAVAAAAPEPGRLLELRDGGAQRVGRLLHVEDLGLARRRLGRDERPVAVGGGAHFLDADFVAAGRGLLLQRAHLDRVPARRVGDERDRLRPLRPVGAVHLDELTAAGGEEHGRHVDAALLDDDADELPGGEFEGVGVMLSAAQLARDGAARRERFGGGRRGRLRVSRGGEEQDGEG
jgi:hypothetical protein